ncbi:MAG: allantoicase [Alphaproteobacteria bacterium MarineAlpha5_Bin9]|nr:MAG: allantoicase [Alphaproteobacteria bacterium MarineAlpha5_Bin9]|tara:strand:- start:2471 stop:3457 length:987 start_codon:yes stop_codon:yes gene_type:complete
MSKKFIKKNNIDLANPNLGTKILIFSDQFFAPAKRIINPEAPIFKEGVYDNHGKWMDGWETRRRRDKGNDYLVIKLGKAGKIKYFDVDTSFFNGNQPQYAQIDGTYSTNNLSKKTKWQKITNKIKIKPDSSNILKSITSKTFTHIRLNIYPDGGVARLKIMGLIDISINKSLLNKNTNLISILNGSRVIACSDEHFGNANNILLPGKSKNMGNGWETRRRRGLGYDWVIIKLAIPAIPNLYEINTHHFKGNFPDAFSIQGAMNGKKLSTKSIIHHSLKWNTIIEKTKLKANNSIRILKNNNKKINYIKLNIFPDGGISRFKIYGKVKF